MTKDASFHSQAITATVSIKKEHRYMLTFYDDFLGKFDQTLRRQMDSNLVAPKYGMALRHCRRKS